VAQLGAGLARAQQGTKAHRLFESLKYVSFAELQAQSDEDLKAPLEFLVKGSAIPLLEIIEKGHVEWGFALQHQGALMQGQIDLWGVLGDTLWMVDYKTGSQKYSETAFRQLKAYAWALSQMGYTSGVTAVKIAVVYPMDEVVKIEDVPSLDTLRSEMEPLLQSYCAKA